MDFSNRNVQPQAAAPGAQNSAPKSYGSNGKKGNRYGRGKVWRILTVLVVAAIAVLIVGVITLIVTSDSKPESKYVDSGKLQAVFLNTGQVYFGHIKSLNKQYFVVTDIYYLQATNASADAASSAANNVTLVKLGCELHEPYDQMVINSDQVTFWENLQDNGQVAKAVTAFQQQNPNGQKCADQSSSASSNSTNNAQNASSNSAKP